MKPMVVSKGAKRAPQAGKAPALNAASQNVRFSGFLPPALETRLLNKSIWTFSQITEVFLWAFLAQDAIAMWMPRIRQSLVTGAIEYDPTQDPENKFLTPWQLLKKHTTKTLQGLNWVNFNEETKREFATGPGVLLIPTIAYAAARRLFCERAVELGHGPLTQLTYGFIEHLKNNPELDQVQLLKNATLSHQGKTMNGIQAFQQEVKNYIKSRFDFGDLLEQTSEFVEHTPQTQNKTSWLSRLTRSASNAAAEVAPTPPVAKEMKVSQYLENWVDRWVTQVFSGDKTSFAHLEKEFEENMLTMNRRLAPSNLYKVDQIKIKLAKQPKDLGNVPSKLTTKTQYLHIDEFTHQLNRWNDFVKNVYKTKIGDRPGFGIIPKMAVSDNLSSLAEKMYRQLVTKKAVLAVTVSGLTGWYLYKLAFWAQNHDSYHATRLLTEDDEPSPSPTASTQPSQQATQPIAAAAPQQQQAQPRHGQPTQPVSPQIQNQNLITPTFPTYPNSVPYTAFHTVSNLPNSRYSSIPHLQPVPSGNWAPVYPAPVPAAYQYGGQAR